MPAELELPADKTTVSSVSSEARKPPPAKLCLPEPPTCPPALGMELGCVTRAEEFTRWKASKSQGLRCLSVLDDLGLCAYMRMTLYHGALAEHHQGKCFGKETPLVLCLGNEGRCRDLSLSLSGVLRTVGWKKVRCWSRSSLIGFFLSKMFSVPNQIS